MIHFRLEFSPHDDFIKWKHFPRYWHFVRGIHRSPVNSLHKGQWGRALVFSLICAWTNSWTNNGDADELRRHLAHYDIVMNIQHQMPGVTWVVGGTTADFKHHTALNIDQQLHAKKWNIITHPWASYQIRKIVGCACAGNAGNVFPATDFKGNPAYITACITARAWRACRDACRDR